MSDGISDDNFDKQAKLLTENLYVKLAAITTKIYCKKRLEHITRYGGSIFTIDEMETLSIWLWNVQVVFF